MPLIVLPILALAWMLVLIAVVTLCRNAARGDRVARVTPAQRRSVRFVRFVA